MIIGQKEEENDQIKIMKTKVVKEIEQKYFPYLKSLRRDFHQYPELGFKEFRTSKIITEELSSLGFEVTEKVGKTGVIGLQRCADETSPVIMLRFDMDALPIEEQNETEYCSQNEGVMHACGHDAHMAIGLTLAKLISENKQDVHATLKFVFQPAEEGLGGAEAMIADGVLDNPRPDYVLGMHVWNERPLGWVGISPGAVMAGADTFSLILTGKGGHGGHPHQTIDPIPVASQIVLATQTIISRNLSPLESGVISFCSIQGGNAFNVIPDQVILRGTIRHYSKKTRSEILEKIKKLSTGIAEANGCQAALEVIEITPPLINTKELIDEVNTKVKNQFPDLIFDQSFKTMVSEDFAFYLENIPGLFIFIGSANESIGLTYGHHHPKFDIDEHVMPVAVAILSKIIEAISKKTH